MLHQQRGTVQRHNDGDLPVTQTNNALPSIEWGPLDEYFSISNIRLGKQKQNIEGKIFIFNAIQFDVKAKIDINWLNLNYTVHFYDRDDIDMGYGSIGFEPKYRLLASAFGMMWQQGMPGIGFINLDSFSKENQNLDNVKKIRIQ